jgi:hypothetical protein
MYNDMVIIMKSLNTLSSAASILGGDPSFIFDYMVWKSCRNTHRSARSVVIGMKREEIIKNILHVRVNIKVM